ncbi:MAG: hypothetical protein ACPGTO_11000 [Polaribacter sp.]
MTPNNKRVQDEEQEFENKIEKGLAIAYKKMIQFKKEKNSVLVVMQGDKIVKIKPEDAI